MIDLSGEITFVTGGANGIGRAIAERFASLGAHVVIGDIDSNTAKEVASTLNATYGVKTLGLSLDISDVDSVKAAFDTTKKSIGSPGVLVNSAGVNVFFDPLEMSPSDWHRCMSINLEGALNCCLSVLPDMIEARDGAIINIISNHAFTVMENTFPYPVAKHALLGLTRSLGLQYASQGISVNAISPGYTDTRLAESDFKKDPDPAAARRKVEAKQPPGRLCNPTEVAAVAALLASHEARFMVGENIVIDGGVSIRMYET